MGVSSAATPRHQHNAAATMPQCYNTALLAGGGVKRGFVYGASDKMALIPRRTGAPHDLAATKLPLLGSIRHPR